MNFEEEKLTAYLDDELAPEERAQVERELSARPELAELLEQLSELRGAIRRLPPILPSDRFADRVREEIAAAEVQRARADRPFGMHRGTWLATAAALLCAVGAVFWLARTESELIVGQAPRTDPPAADESPAEPAAPDAQLGPLSAPADDADTPLPPAEMSSPAGDLRNFGAPREPGAGRESESAEAERGTASRLADEDSNALRFRSDSFAADADAEPSAPPPARLGRQQRLERDRAETDDGAATLGEQPMSEFADGRGGGRAEPRPRAVITWQLRPAETDAAAGAEPLPEQLAEDEVAATAPAAERDAPGARHMVISVPADQHAAASREIAGLLARYASPRAKSAAADAPLAARSAPAESPEREEADRADARRRQPPEPQQLRLPGPRIDEAVSALREVAQRRGWQLTVPPRQATRQDEAREEPPTVIRLEAVSP